MPACVDKSALFMFAFLLNIGSRGCHVNATAIVKRRMKLPVLVAVATMKAGICRDGATYWLWWIKTNPSNTYPAHTKPPQNAMSAAETVFEVQRKWGETKLTSDISTAATHHGQEHGIPALRPRGGVCLRNAPRGWHAVIAASHSL